LKILVLGLGNDLLGDDAAGLLAARALRDAFDPEQAEVIETSLCGIALLDHFIGYQKAVIIDAIKTGKHPPGSIIELQPEDLSAVAAPSPHYAGLPEMMALAKQLSLAFPEEIKIFALEVVDPYTIGGAVSEAVTKALPSLVERVGEQVRRWREEKEATDHA
jgi:hydrogenase maturation protease